MRSPDLHRPALLPLLLVLGAGCASTDPQRDVAYLVRHGEYARAVRVAERNAEREPGSESAQRLLVQARVAYLLDDARQTLFAGEPAKALGLLEVADELDPANPTVATWIAKVRRQLAEQWLDAANDLYALRDLERALEAYEGALRFDPESNTAKLGIARVLVTMNYREGQSKSYYDVGLESMRDFFLPQADNSFAKSLYYDEDNAHALRRKAEVAAMLLDERLGIARELEEQELYFAARNEYRMALLVDADDPRAQEGYDRMDRETRARRALDDAAMDVLRGDVEGARESLEQSTKLTEEQQEHVTALENELEERRLEELYQRGLELQRDFRYEEAIAAYDGLLEQSDGYYKDALVRRDSLIDFSERARRLYASFQEAETDAERLRYLREIDVFWPEYRDVSERIDDYVQRGNALFRQAGEAESSERALELLEELRGFWPSYPGLEQRVEALRAHAKGEG